MTEAVLERLRALRVVAVLRARSARDAVEVSEALMEGGITALEITFTTPDAERAMRELGDAHGDAILLGAGTVNTPEQVEAAVAGGARFLVSPGCNPELVGRMQGTGLAVLPGVLTPSEVMLARNLGVRVVKLFPGSLGGPSYLEALRAPFPEMAFVPTGGVSAANAADWLAAGAWAIGAGGALAPASLGGEDRPAVVERARALVAAAAGTGTQEG